MAFVESPVKSFYKRVSGDNTKFCDKIAYVGGPSFRRRPWPFGERRSCNIFHPQYLCVAGLSWEWSKSWVKVRHTILKMMLKCIDGFSQVARMLPVNSPQVCCVSFLLWPPRLSSWLLASLSRCGTLTHNPAESSRTHLETSTWS